MTGGRIPVAIVGLGRIASLLEDDRLREMPCTHAGAITGNPELALVAGADTDPERRRLVAERWGVPVYADAALMLKEQRPALLHIATHPDSHLLYCELAAGAGVGAVVCEKPLADTLARARKIAALEKSGKLRIITNHERRYSADYIYARRRILDGRYGELLSITAKLYFGGTRKLISQLIHDGTHLVDIIAFLAGGYLEKPEVCGNLNKKTGTAFIRSRVRGSGVPVLIEAGAERDYLSFEIDLTFSAGRIRIGNGLYEEYESKTSPYYEGFKSLIKQETAPFAATGYFLSMMKDAAACARDPKRIPASDAASGYEALKFILSLEKG
jgi:predicted dehydrogenase